MKIACMILGSALLAPFLPALAGDASSDITPERKAHIIAAAKVGQTALRTYANKLRVFNVRIDFDSALDIAPRACLSDASSRSKDVWQAARLADSPCNGWVARTFIPVNDAARNSMLAYLVETSQREGLRGIMHCNDGATWHSWRDFSLEIAPCIVVRKSSATF